jgi:hypothetical protein
MAGADLEYLVGLGQRFAIAESGSPELRDTVLRIALRQAIQSWDSGKPLERECTALVQAKGEVCHWEEPAGLLIRRTKREYVGGYGSVSIPLHIVRGARVRVGGFKGVPIDKTVHEDGGRGVLHITNQRVCFTALNQAVAIPFKKIVSLAGFDEGFDPEFQIRVSVSRIINPSCHGHTRIATRQAKQDREFLGSAQRLQ